MMLFTMEGSVQIERHIRKLIAEYVRNYRAHGRRWLSVKRTAKVIYRRNAYFKGTEADNRVEYSIRQR